MGTKVGSSRDEGGVDKGIVAQVRAAALTASQCATYDVSKQLWMELTGWSDNLPTHLGASMATGLVTTTVTAPVRQHPLSVRIYVPGHVVFENPKWHFCSCHFV